MTTTSSTSNTSTGSQILSALSAGSGIDTSALTTSLASATYDPKIKAVTDKQTANTAKVSALGTLTSGIDAFASALGSLIKGGTLSTQPTSSDSTVLTATAKPGAQIGSLSAQLSVQKLAQAQSLVSDYVPSSTAAVGTGGLTITVGSTRYQVKIDGSNNSLAGIARAINSSMASVLNVDGASTSVTATVVTDGKGARLALKGPTGAANAFTITADAGSDAALLKLAYPPEGLSVSGTAVTSAPLADETATAVGTGSFTLTNGGSSATVTIDASNNTLDGMVAAINAAGVGLTASVTTDASGAHLSISDGSAAAPSFTLLPASGADTGLSRFAYPPVAVSGGTTQAQAAQDAVVQLNGVEVTRSSNTIDDLVDGVTLSLKSAVPTETVSLGATRPTDAIKQSVQDFVDAYNELKGKIDTATARTVTDDDGNTTTGPLYGNTAVRAMMTQLSQLTSTVLNTSGGPSTLAEIGVKTERDGTLTLDATALSVALTKDPDGVEALFNPTQHASSPLIRITSDMGRTKPGTYTLTGMKAPTGSSNAAGMIDGKPAVPAVNGTRLYAPFGSAANGLQIAVDGDVANATVTIDLGLGGALQAIRDGLRDSKTGVLSALSTQLSTEKTDLADQVTKLNDQEADYKDKLITQFTQMNSDVSNFKSIQSYLTQQIAIWTKSDN